MALSKAKADKEDLLNCPICSEVTIQPKILPCMHSFCKQCIHEHISNIGRSANSRITQFTCPVCRSVVKPRNPEAPVDEWSPALQYNLTLDIMISTTKGDKQQDCNVCEQHHQKSLAKFWCKSCEKTLCEKCNTMHKWLLSSHPVITLEEFGKNISGLDLHAVSENCNEHPSNSIEAFCFNHDQLCCIQCVTTNHWNCESVKSIEEITNSDSVYETIQDKLECIKQATLKLLNEKQKQKHDLKEKLKTTGNDAAMFFEQVKCKLDAIFETFKKQLNVFLDEQNTNLNIRMRLLEQFVGSLDHWITVNRVVKEFGTKTQHFIQVETMKNQITASLIEIDKVIKHETSFNIKFAKTEILEQLETADTIGMLNKTELDLGDQITDIRNCCKTLGIKCRPNFIDIGVELVKTFHIKGSYLSCGVCVGKDHIILGNRSLKNILQVFEKKSGFVINTAKIAVDACRLCYDEEHNQIFISSFEKKILYKAEIVGNRIRNPAWLTFNKDYVGASCKHKKHIYIVVDKAIKKFVSTAGPNSSTEMSTVVSTNTDCGTNGMNIFRQKIIYTTKDKEVKCITLDGEEVYCFKNEMIKTPECIVALPSGLVLVVDRNNKGSLHVLSEDGTKHKTLLQKFNTISDPRDIWLDNNDSETFYIAGGEYLEMYRITCD
ncbi:E3 ubiquitin-protein ligase TRIM45-like [Mytilus galloprovincialis]|uniref:E3 ubiquitin-protein ligase TRIM45-like n=1 Tax=Mytilus galloprovincialis TaxID=29158 RepID=UPI003F7B99E3